jgi:hypothetical protein
VARAGRGGAARRRRRPGGRAGRHPPDRRAGRPGQPAAGELSGRHLTGLAVGSRRAGAVRRRDGLAGAARPDPRRGQAPPGPAGPARGDRVGGRRSGPGGARRGRGMGTARVFGGRASAHGIAGHRSRGRRRARARAGRGGAHPAPRAAAAGPAGRQGDRPRTSAVRCHGELADRQAADPPGGPGPARRHRDGDHHAGGPGTPAGGSRPRTRPPSRLARTWAWTPRPRCR